MSLPIVIMRMRRRRNALVTLLGATFNTTSGTKTVTATPVLGDLIIIFAAADANGGVIAVSDNQGGVYTTIATSVRSTSLDTMVAFVRNTLVTSAVSTIYTMTVAVSDTGGGLVVLNIAGMSQAGAGVVRQSAQQDNQIGAGVPTPTLASAANAGNALVGAVFNGSDPATITPRAGWTELADLGFGAPNTGIEVMSINSGETAAAIAWGSTAGGSPFCDIVAELNV